MVGRLKLVGSRVLVDNAETSGQFQLFVDEPLQIEVVSNSGITRIVECVQCGVIQRVGIIKGSPVITRI